MSRGTTFVSNFFTFCKNWGLGGSLTNGWQGRIWGELVDCFRDHSPELQILKLSIVHFAMIFVIALAVALYFKDLSLDVRNRYLITTSVLKNGKKIKNQNNIYFKISAGGGRTKRRRIIIHEEQLSEDFKPASCRGAIIINTKHYHFVI